MVRSYDAEVPSVQRGNLADLQPFGCGDDGGIDRAEREVAIASGQFGDAQPVTGDDRLWVQRAGGEIAQEPDLRFETEARGDEVGNLAYDEDRDKQWPWVALEQFETLGVVAVVSVDVGVKGTGID